MTFCQTLNFSEPKSRKYNNLARGTIKVCYNILARYIESTVMQCVFECNTLICDTYLLFKAITGCLGSCWRQSILDRVSCSSTINACSNNYEKFKICIWKIDNSLYRSHCMLMFYFSYSFAKNLMFETKMRHTFLEASLQ